MYHAEKQAVLRHTRGGHIQGTGPLGPRVRARGGQQQVAGEGLCLCRQQRRAWHSHGYYWGPFGGPEGRGPAEPGFGSRRSWRQTPLTGQGKVVPAVAWPPTCQPYCAQVPPTGSCRRPAEVCRHMRASPQPAVASMLPSRPPCQARTGLFLSGPPLRLSRTAGYGAVGRVLVNPGMLETAQVRQEQCPIVALWGRFAATCHQSYVVNSPHGSSFASQALGGLGPGQAPARSIQKPFTVGIKAACVGPERQALPCPIALSLGISFRLVWG